MGWDEGLLTKQKIAASHVGCHARVLAGPGTGKTFTLCRRIAYLVNECNVSPEQILALTFTRSAAYELRQRVSETLNSNSKGISRISTLHSFALRQLLKNAHIITAVPTPLRIAGDWEERYIIEEDLKRMLSASLKDIRYKLAQLSSDWQTLTADEDDWETRYPDPEFLGAWREHRKTYGYMLRAELVYQLKKVLEQNPGFTLEQSFQHTLVDEYQDLNRCDLAVIRAISKTNIEIFACGDDDQSIYGFRFAHPEGIRRFNKDYSPCELLDLDYCRRCDRNILKLGLFVASLDTKRIPKSLKPMPDATDGEVKILWFDDEDQESASIAIICKHLIEAKSYSPKDILVLLRNDRYGVFSGPLKEALTIQGIPVASRTDELDPIDQPEGQKLLALLHLCVNPLDSLALRTLLEIRDNNIGSKTIQGAYDLAVRQGLTFAVAMRHIKDSPDLLPRLGSRLSNELTSIESLLAKLPTSPTQPEELTTFISDAAELVVQETEQRDNIIKYLGEVLEKSGAKKLDELLSNIFASLGDKEQEIDSDSVNILTMHKAKGLTADAVFIVAAEDEHIPGDRVGQEVDDERRLLYVSLTRARHSLFLTYCRMRKGRQRFSGRNSGHSRRHLTEFLTDSPISPESGTAYVRTLYEQ